jgi:hypothetical protein
MEQLKENMKQYWVASNGSITLFDFKLINKDVEDFICEKWGDCEWGELSSFTDMRGEDYEEEEDSSSEEEETESEEEEEKEERYCDNKDCPYLGYCYGEVKDEYEGKPYICVGCSTGKGLQEQEQEPKKYELQEDCWNIVKDFAGIYNLTTKWNKLENLGIEKIHDTLKQHGRTRLTNYKRNTLDSKKIIYKLLLTKYKSFKLMCDLNDLINPKKEEDNSFDDYKVGDEVIYYSGRGWCGSSRLGKIIKINKSSITWAQFEVSHKVSDNPNACQFQQFEEVKHYYDKTKTMKPKCIKSNISKPQDYQADYFRETHDWGR